MWSLLPSSVVKKTGMEICKKEVGNLSEYPVSQGTPVRMYTCNDVHLYMMAIACIE